MSTENKSATITRASILLDPAESPPAIDDFVTYWFQRNNRPPDLAVVGITRNPPTQVFWRHLSGLNDWFGRKINTRLVGHEIVLTVEGNANDNE